MSEKILDIKDLSIRYVTEEETVLAFNGISFSLDKGESI